MKKIVKGIGIAVLFIILFEGYSCAWVVVEDNMKSNGTPNVVIQCGNGDKERIFYDSGFSHPWDYGMVLTYLNYKTLKEAADHRCMFSGK